MALQCVIWHLASSEKTLRTVRKAWIGKGHNCLVHPIIWCTSPCLSLALWSKKAPLLSEWVLSWCLVEPPTANTWTTKGSRIMKCIFSCCYWSRKNATFWSRPFSKECVEEDRMIMYLLFRAYLSRYLQNPFISIYLSSDLSVYPYIHPIDLSFLFWNCLLILHPCGWSYMRKFVMGPLQTCVSTLRYCQDTLMRFDWGPTLALVIDMLHQAILIHPGKK